MKLADGKIVPETKDCVYCSGAGKREEWISCPNHGRAMRGKACQFCKSTTKHNHQPINTGKIISCKTCNGTGYKGRIGMYEVMEVSEEIQELILVGASAREIKRKAVEEGMVALRQSGLNKIRAGITTLDEVLRETVLN